MFDHLGFSYSPETSQSAMRLKGDLLKLARAGKFDVIVHGCNCMGSMGGGIASQIAEQYPIAAMCDQEMAATFDHPMGLLGNYSHCVVNNEQGGSFTIVNAYTQYRGGAGTLSYNALELALYKISDRWGTAKIGIPYIGCGIAGGDIGTLVEVFDSFAHKVNQSGGAVTLVEYSAD